MKPLIRKLACACAISLAGVGTAAAYIDPGTGSMLLQMMGAAVAGAIFYFRELRMKVVSLFSRRPPPAAREGDEATPGDEPR
ncbi:MAG TPA: hypothetical protein VFM30_00250 [Steroidobacteraceae bacterium]|nr:hypothetical protein [Steroidobacteraceae bacterium]